MFHGQDQGTFPDRRRYVRGTGVNGTYNVHPSLVIHIFRPGRPLRQFRVMLLLALNVCVLYVRLPFVIVEPRLDEPSAFCVGVQVPITLAPKLRRWQRS